jgi:all-trans-retinol 13,14-reductase
MTHIGKAYKQSNLGDHWDAIVIGSGIGGLTSAALLARHGGKRVLVLERHYTAGGFTHTFHRPGYEWDVGVHYIGEVGDPRSPVRAAFDEVTGGQLQWNPMPDVYDRIVIDGRSYDFPSGVNRFRERLKEYFPQEAAAIDRYITEVEGAADASGAFFDEKAVPEAVARVAGPLMRKQFLRYAERTTASVLYSLTRNRELIGVLTGQWGDYGLPPGESSFGMHAIVARHYFGGASYPVGGASRIAASMLPVIERAGGRVVVSADVTRILTSPAGSAIGARMADGREFRARCVISDAGALNTFERLLDPAVAAGLDAARPLRSIPRSMSHLSFYVGLKQSAAELGIPATNLWIYRDADHDASVARSAADPNEPFPCLFISFPSAKDPSFRERCPGRSTIEVLTPAPYRWFEGWADTRWKKRGADYDEFKRGLARKMQEELERHVPAVCGRIDYAELSTPLTTRHFANHPQGEIYGLSVGPDRFRLASLGARTPVRDLYLTGADVVAPGVTGALYGGFISASLVLGRNLKSAAGRSRFTFPARAAISPEMLVADCRNQQPSGDKAA